MNYRTPQGSLGNMQFWDRIYQGQTLRYGSDPNSFVAQTVNGLIEGGTLEPGSRAVDVATGEGRNALYLARVGLRVTAVDSSRVGLEKARERAAAEGVTLEFIEEDIFDWEPQEPFALLVTTFLHLPRERMEPLYRKLASLLAPKGHLVAEWFHPDQRTGGYRSGGPPEASMMVRPEDLVEPLEGWEIVTNRSVHRQLEEGSGHRGEAVVTQLLAVRP